MLDCSDSWAVCEDQTRSFCAFTQTDFAGLHDARGQARAPKITPLGRYTPASAHFLRNLDEEQRIRIRD